MLNLNYTACYKNLFYMLLNSFYNKMIFINALFRTETVLSISIES